MNTSVKSRVNSVNSFWGLMHGKFGKEFSHEGYNGLKLFTLFTLPHFWATIRPSLNNLERVNSLSQLFTNCSPFSNKTPFFLTGNKMRRGLALLNLSDEQFEPKKPKLFIVLLENSQQGDPVKNLTRDPSNNPWAEMAARADLIDRLNAAITRWAKAESDLVAGRDNPLFTSTDLARLCRCRDEAAHYLQSLAPNLDQPAQTCLDKKNESAETSETSLN